MPRPCRITSRQAGSPLAFPGAPARGATRLSDFGAPDWIRTNDTRLRKPVLYPAELRGPVLSLCISGGWNLPREAKKVKGTVWPAARFAMLPDMIRPSGRSRAWMLCFYACLTLALFSPVWGLLDASTACAEAAGEDKRAQDLARTIMSPFCPGRTLEACPSPYATEWREDIRKWVAEGVSSEEIRARLAARRPDKDLTGAPTTAADSFLPAILSVMAVVALVLLLRRLLKPAPTGAARTTSSAEPKARDPELLEARLNEELAHLDD